MKHYPLSEVETEGYYRHVSPQGTYNSSGKFTIRKSEGVVSGYRGPRAPIAGTTLLPDQPYFRADFDFVSSPASAIGTQAAVNTSFTWTNWLRGLQVGSPALTMTGIVMPDAVDANTLVAAAIAKCRPNFDLLTSLSEAHKTVNMVKKVRNRFSDLITQSTLHGFHHKVDVASQVWMEWRYGWRLLSYDLESMVKLLRKPLSDVVVRGSVKMDPITKTSHSESIEDYGIARIQDIIDHRDTVAYKAHAAVSYAYVTPNMGWSVPVTAWELVPLSWVADLFVNIGTLLEAWDVLRLSNGSTQSIGIYQVELGTAAQTYLSSTSTSVVSGTATATTKNERRVRLPWSLPYYLPALRVRLQSEHILDIASVLKKRIRIPAAIATATLLTMTES